MELSHPLFCFRFWFWFWLFLLDYVAFRAGQLWKMNIFLLQCMSAEAVTCNAWALGAAGMGMSWATLTWLRCVCAGLVLVAVTNGRWHLSNMEQPLVSCCMSFTILSLLGGNYMWSDFPPLGWSDWLVSGVGNAVLSRLWSSHQTLNVSFAILYYKVANVRDVFRSLIAAWTVSEGFFWQHCLMH